MHYTNTCPKQQSPKLNILETKKCQKKEQKLIQRRKTEKNPQYTITAQILYLTNKFNIQGKEKRKIIDSGVVWKEKVEWEAEKWNGISSECILGMQVGESDTGKLQPDVPESLPTIKADFDLKY